MANPTGRTLRGGDHKSIRGSVDTKSRGGVLLHLGSYWFFRILGTVTPDRLWSLKSGPPLPLHRLRTTWLLGGPEGQRGHTGKGRGVKAPPLGRRDSARPRPCYLMGLPLPPPEAEAAWLTCWSHVVVFVGFISIVEPTSSNSKSSASEPYWRTSVRFWALPVLPTPWMPAHWVELSPVWETLNDWLSSPLSASCSLSWEIAGLPLPPPPLWRWCWRFLPSLRSPLSRPLSAKAGRAAATSTASSAASRTNFLMLFLRVVVFFYACLDPGSTTPPSMRSRS